MSYVDPNYKSKKDFKAAVTLANAIRFALDLSETLGERSIILKEFGRPAEHQTYNPSGMFSTPQNGSDVVEGPHYPKPHRWYAEVVVKDGVVVKVK